MQIVSPDWLREYYGSDFDRMNPQVMAEKKNKAIVMIRQNGVVGYVLVTKRGRHNATPHVSLHEGMANQATVAKMIEQLDREDP